MKRALFTSKNLLGDGLNIGPALRAWANNNPYGIEILTINDQIQDIYHRMGLDVSIIYEEEQKRPLYDFEFNFDVGTAFTIGQQKGKHITECYAEMLGVEIPNNELTFITTEEDHEKDLILMSLFSKSCESNKGRLPNKMLPWKKVEPILNYFRTLGKIGILGGPNDRAPIEASEDEYYSYYSGLPLNKVALMLRDCKFLFTIDNGMAHLATSQKTKSIVLYPACLSMSWIAPIGNPNAFVIQMNPVTIPLPSLMWQTKEILKQWQVI
jgi:ADP-heptose:LPS heptosyltransferase